VNRESKIKALHKISSDKVVYEFLDSNLLPSITRDSSRSLIRYAQEKLIDAGYHLPEYGADGRLGRETTSAINAFKRDQGLEEDGILGQSDLRRLLSHLDLSLSGPGQERFRSLKEISQSITNGDAQAEPPSGEALLVGDSQMQGGIGSVLQGKYGGSKRLSKGGSNALYWTKRSDFKSSLMNKPSRIIVQLNSNNIEGTEKFISLIEEHSPDSEVIWYGAPPSILWPKSRYSVVRTEGDLGPWNNSREKRNIAVKGMLGASSLNARFIDPFSDIFDMTKSPVWRYSDSDHNRDGVHLPLSVAQKFYA
jgi:hypothetical protein